MIEITEAGKKFAERFLAPHAPDIKNPKFKWGVKGGSVVVKIHNDEKETAYTVIEETQVRWLNSEGVES